MAKEKITEAEETKVKSAKSDDAKADKKAAKEQKKAEKASKPGFFKRIARYFKDLSGEFKKVVWPTKSQTINNTIVVVVTCAICGLFVWGLDSLFNFIITTLILQQ